MTPTKRIALILTVIFLLPALFFSVYEISSLSKDEEMVENIYHKQLEALLFSVNQYSDDVLNSWMTKTETALGPPPHEAMPPALQTLLEWNSSMQMAFVVDTIDGKSSLQLFSLNKESEALLRQSLYQNLDQNPDQVRQLTGYRSNGFQKIQALQNRPKELDGLQALLFIMEASHESFNASGFLIDEQLFVEDIVGPRLQIISRDQFVLSVFDKTSGNAVYSTLLGDTATVNAALLTKDLWIFPNYVLGIRTQGPSLHQVVQERTTTNLFLLLGLDIILIVALVLAFRSVKKEVQLAQNKADFVSNVSHEIRTPLALISMFAETLEMGRLQSEEKKREYYTIISKETQRLTGIVNKILNFSQTEAGKKNLHVERVDLSKELKGMLGTYDFHLKSKGFNYELEEGKEIHVLADKEAFIEMVINLIDNAVKYSSDYKRIEITLGKDAAYGWVAIKDFGVGITKADQKHIFDKFYRVPSGNLARSRGTGLGLSLVKQLIEQQKGRISVTSELGTGSTFTLYFPLD